ncbi:ABC transporter permease subunit, partial [Hydrogenophaga sp. NFH-34]|uniref:ABC transporter permease subunit n=1 Tax=Hydrogenophaga sp. NFH-34 TaxID=2744446 RepID=UPI003FA3665B
MRTASRWSFPRIPQQHGDKRMLTINLFNGLVYGSLLIVMCSGLALIYGLRRVVNFAHGSLYMLGA